MAVTPERAREFLFGIPYLLTEGVLFMPQRGGQVERGGVPGDVFEATIRSVATPSAGPLVGAVHQLLPKAAVIEVRDYREAFEAVLAHKADAAALNRHAGTYLAERHFPGTFLQIEEPRLPATELAVALWPGEGEGTFLPRTWLGLLDGGLAAVARGGGLARLVRAWGLTENDIASGLRPQGDLPERDHTSD